MTAAYVANRLTRGEDALYLAARRASMGDLEAAAGVNDLMQGADMLAASEDITTISDRCPRPQRGRPRGRDGNRRNLRRAGRAQRRAGLAGHGNMAEFLLDRSQRLRELAVDNIMRYGACAPCRIRCTRRAPSGRWARRRWPKGRRASIWPTRVAENSEAMAIAGRRDDRRGAGRRWPRPRARWTPGELDLARRIGIGKVPAETNRVDGTTTRSVSEDRNAEVIHPFNRTLVRL
jgi:hypothetical protein